jgi:hypothetical protein
MIKVLQYHSLIWENQIFQLNLNVIINDIILKYNAYNLKMNLNKKNKQHMNMHYQAQVYMGELNL